MWPNPQIYRFKLCAVMWIELRYPFALRVKELIRGKKMLIRDFAMGNTIKNRDKAINCITYPDIFDDNLDKRFIFVKIRGNAKNTGTAT